MLTSWRNIRTVTRLVLAVVAVGACDSDATGPEGADDYVALGVGFSHACVVRDDGAAECWGDDAAFQLGQGTRQPFCPGFEIPCSPRPRPVSGALQWRDVDAGTAFSCGVTTAGAAYCWGLNTEGQLGVGGASQTCLVAPYALQIECRETPTPVAGDVAFVDIALGAEHACALSDAGEAYCWGENGDGRLGTGTADARTTPARVMHDVAFAQLALGNLHTCGIAGSGALYCWGSNSDGQLGDEGGNALAPRAVLPDQDFSDIAAGAHHTCALTTGGVTYCWGDNHAGQIGDGTIGASGVLPTMIATPSPLDVLGAGDQHTCGSTAQGVLYCWGSNAYGQLGDGTRDTRTVPTAVQLDADVIEVDGGWRHTCALDRGGTAWCWGLNTLGQLGNTASTSTPQPVPGPVGEINFRVEP